MRSNEEGLANYKFGYGKGYTAIYCLLALVEI